MRFGAQCGFCHGKDAAGGETGPDLTRAELVAQDSRGDKLAPVIRAGRPNAGMPAFTDLTQGDLNAIVAFLHTQMDKFAELGGGRRSVEPSDLATGNAAAGRDYFNGTGKCASCHSATGDLAGIGKNYQGLDSAAQDALSQRARPGRRGRESDLHAALGPDRRRARRRRGRLQRHRPRSLGARQTYQRAP